MSALPKDASSLKRGSIEYQIIDVWASNLDQELSYIIELIEKYPFVAMDTEFPGVVVRPMGTFKSSSEFHYQTLRCNVNLLKIIQLGLTLCDEKGRVPNDGRCVWQFNFRFDLAKDMFAQDSIDLLRNSGINFTKHQQEGIDVQEFAEKLMCSGIVLSNDVRWISFHSAYDFGYLIKLLTNAPLPPTEQEFFDQLKLYFPYIYDIKYLMKSCDTLKGGLNQLAEDLNVQRIGPAHQAGSDSLLTLHTFFALMEKFFDNNFDEAKYIGVLYGLGSGANDSNGGVVSNGSVSANGTPLFTSSSGISSGSSVNQIQYFASPKVVNSNSMLQQLPSDRFSSQTFNMSPGFSTGYVNGK